jgi:hypothetical protein
MFEWSGGQWRHAPDDFWVDDKTEQLVRARDGARLPAGMMLVPCGEHGKAGEFWLKRIDRNLIVTTISGGPHAAFEAARSMLERQAAAEAAVRLAEPAWTRDGRRVLHRGQPEFVIEAGRITRPGRPGPSPVQLDRITQRIVDMLNRDGPVPPPAADIDASAIGPIADAVAAALCQHDEPLIRGRSQDDITRLLLLLRLAAKRGMRALLATRGAGEDRP